MRKCTAVLREEDGGYVAECPEVGTVSQGDTKEEAFENLKAATELYLDEIADPDHQAATVFDFELA